MDIDVVTVQTPPVEQNNFRAKITAYRVHKVQFGIVKTDDIW